MQNVPCFLSMENILYILTIMLCLIWLICKLVAVRQKSKREIPPEKNMILPLCQPNLLTMYTMFVEMYLWTWQESCCTIYASEPGFLHAQLAKYSYLSPQNLFLSQLYCTASAIFIFPSAYIFAEYSTVDCISGRRGKDQLLADAENVHCIQTGLLVSDIYSGVQQEYLDSKDKTSI